MRGSGVSVLVLVWALVPCACGLARFAFYEDGQELSVETLAMTYGKFLGNQTKVVGIANARVSVLAVTHAPEPGSLDCSGFAGTVVLVDTGHTGWLWEPMFRTCVELQRCGAVAVVRLTSHFSGQKAIQGFGFYTTDHDCCKSRHDAVRIPVVDVWKNDVREWEERALANTTVLVSIPAVDRNPWVEDVYHNPVFVIGLRIALPVLNVAVGLLAVRALASHVPRLFHQSPQQRVSVLDSMRGYVVFALVLQVVGCALRATYLAITPFFSNSNLNFQQSMFLINTSLPIQLPVILVVSAAFRRMVNMTSAPQPPSPVRVALFALLCVAVAAMEGVGAYGRAYLLGVEVVLVYSGAVSCLIALVCTVVFIGAGVPFLRRLQGKRVSGLRNSRPHSVRSTMIRRRFTQSIVYGTVGLVMQIVVVLVFVVSPSVVYRPAALPSVLALNHLGYTVAALFHVLAFAPVTFRPNRPDGAPASLAEVSGVNVTAIRPRPRAKGAHAREEQEAVAAGAGDAGGVDGLGPTPTVGESVILSAGGDGPLENDEELGEEMKDEEEEAECRKPGEPRPQDDVVANNSAAGGQDRAQADEHDRAGQEGGDDESGESHAKRTQRAKKRQHGLQRFLASRLEQLSFVLGPNNSNPARRAKSQEPQPRATPLFHKQTDGKKKEKQARSWTAPVRQDEGAGQVEGSPLVPSVL